MQQHERVGRGEKGRLRRAGRAFLCGALLALSGGCASKTQYSYRPAGPRPASIRIAGHIQAPASLSGKQVEMMLTGVPAQPDARQGSWLSVILPSTASKDGTVTAPFELKAVPMELEQEAATRPLSVRGGSDEYQEDCVPGQVLYRQGTRLQGVEGRSSGTHGERGHRPVRLCDQGKASGGGVVRTENTKARKPRRP